jgi:hypothetical protein
MSTRGKSSPFFNRDISIASESKGAPIQIYILHFKVAGKLDHDGKSETGVTNTVEAREGKRGKVLARSALHDHVAYQI